MKKLFSILFIFVLLSASLSSCAYHPAAPKPETDSASFDETENASSDYGKTAFDPTLLGETADGPTYDGLLYNEDFSKLIDCPPRGVPITFHPNLKTIGELAFEVCGMEKVVIPWGVTTVEEYAFDDHDTLFILPDTIKEFHPGKYGYGENLLFSFYRDEIERYFTNSPDRRLVDWYNKLDSCEIHEYYGIEKDSWKDLNGETYYFSSTENSWNGETVPFMVTGWKEIDGYWYRFGTMEEEKPGALLSGPHFKRKEDGVPICHQYDNREDEKSNLFTTAYYLTIKNGCISSYRNTSDREDRRWEDIEGDWACNKTVTYYENFNDAYLEKNALESEQLTKLTLERIDGNRCLILNLNTDYPYARIGKDLLFYDKYDYLIPNDHNGWRFLALG